MYKKYIYSNNIVLVWYVHLSLQNTVGIGAGALTPRTGIKNRAEHSSLQILYLFLNFKTGIGEIDQEEEIKRNRVVHNFY